MKPELKALLEAVEIAGGQSALARLATPFAKREITQKDVWSWINRSKRVPPDCAIPVEMAVEGRVTRYRLRLDIFGPAPVLDVPAEPARAG